MKSYIIIAFLLLATGLKAQQKNAVLMDINGHPVTVQEFENMYTKNIDLVQDPAQKDIDNYRQLFTHYKLELEDAYQKKYDTFPQLNKELQSYRRDLAKKYLSDNDIINHLVQEAYRRMKTDVHVAHILIQVAPDAAPQDTLVAYKKIMSIYKKIKKGADFGQMAQQYSDDPSAKQNKGDLDYINVFHTVYPFETAAYQTLVGQISKPFRTRFGYHIVKVLDKRPAKGQIEVAHILALNKKSKAKNATEDAKTRIYKIYDKLKNKQDSFENLARKFSDDKNSAKRGGRLRKFGIRAMIPPFEKAAFSLKKEGDISQPFQTKYGWHIVKLLKKYPVPPFSQVKQMLRRKVLRDERSKMGKEKLLQKISREFPIDMIGNLKTVYRHITDQFFVNKWQIPEDKTVNQTLFTINKDQKITYKDFYQYLYRRQSHNKTAKNNKTQIINRFFKRFKKEKLFNYYNHHLEDIYPEFAQTMKEYKNGLMLFKIKSDMVWNKSVQDTLGLQKYFAQHQQHYKLPVRYDVLTVQANDKKTAKRISKALSKGDKQKTIAKKFATENILLKEKTYLKNDDFIKKHNLKINKPVIYKDGQQYLVLYLVRILPESLPTLKDVKGEVTNDYQNALEQQWLDALKKAYPIKINETVWQQLRKKYKK